MVRIFSHIWDLENNFISAPQNSNKRGPGLSKPNLVPQLLQAVANTASTQIFQLSAPTSGTHLLLMHGLLPSRATVSCG